MLTNRTVIILHVLTALLIATFGRVQATFAGAGVIEINQARAVKGSVSPGDTPGFPVLLTVSGSYRLTSNLDVAFDNHPLAANRTAIDVQASDVTIDLGGFTIRGPYECTTTPEGITSCPAFTGADGVRAYVPNVVVKNGIVRGMGGGGVFLAGPGSSVSAVLAISNTGIGIYSEGLVSDCIARRNGSAGIKSQGAMAQNSIALENHEAGIYANKSERNVVLDNEWYAIFGPAAVRNVVRARGTGLGIFAILAAANCVATDSSQLAIGGPVGPGAVTGAFASNVIVSGGTSDVVSIAPNCCTDHLCSP